MSEEEKKDNVEAEAGPETAAPVAEAEVPKETEVAVAPQSALTKGSPALGTEQISAEDVTFPRFRLLQKTSTEVEKGEMQAGMIKHSLTGETFEKVELIPLMLSKSRIMFNIDDRKGAPLCRSIEDKLEHGSGCDCGCENVCVNCTFSKWVQGAPPVCNLVYNYACIRVDQVNKNAMPTLLSIMKSSTPAAQTLNTFTKWNMETVDGKLQPAPFWSKVIELFTVSKEFKKGTAYMFDIKVGRDTTDVEKQWSLAIYNMAIAGKKLNTEFSADDLED